MTNELILEHKCFCESKLYKIYTYLLQNRNIMQLLLKNSQNSIARETNIIFKNEKRKMKYI